jgi:rare lipoprotein A
MRYAIRIGGALASLLILGSCAGVDGDTGGGGLQTASTSPVSRSAVSDEPVKIGAPYTIGSTSYTPIDVTSYDEVGYTSYYGAEMAGRPTANGEMFIPGGVTAAHKTLPMPSYVEVTALDTGRTILVRVNDRGPFANDRLIDLSEGAAQQLGITAQGVSGVRVRRVNPPEQERAVLREGLRAAERIETPESLLRVLRDKLSKQPRPSGAVAVSRPVPQPGRVTPAPAPRATADGRFIREGGEEPMRATPPPRARQPVAAADGGYVVQVASFSSRSRADSLARKLGANVAVSADGKLFRVRYGPYASEADGERGLAKAKARGYPQARLYRD